MSPQQEVRTNLDCAVRTNLDCAEESANNPTPPSQEVTSPQQVPTILFPPSSTMTPLIPLETDAFKYTKDGSLRKDSSGKASAMAKSRQVNNITNAIIDNNLTSAQQVMALHEAAKHPKIRSVIKSAGLILPKNAEVAVYHESQRKRLLERATSTGKRWARATDDKRSLVESNLLACADSPQTENNRNEISKGASISKRARIKSLGLTKTTGYRLLKNAEEKRKVISVGTKISWSAVQKRKGYSKVSLQLRKKLHDWIIEHPHVISSPIADDTLLVPNPENPKTKVRVGKLLLQISYCELHNDLLSTGREGLPEAKDNNGKPLISDTALRALLPPQVRTMTERYKQMCGCEICIVVRSMQSSLNIYRLDLLKRLRNDASTFRPNTRNRRIATERAEAYAGAIYPNGQHIHGRPKDALQAIQCDPPR
jgi:hypothetical protein